MFFKIILKQKKKLPLDLKQCNESKNYKLWNPAFSAINQSKPPQ